MLAYQFGGEMSKKADGSFSIPLKLKQHREETILIEILMQGKEIMSKKITSNTENAETLINLLRATAGMILTTSNGYKLEQDELLVKCIKLLNDEYNNLLKIEKDEQSSS